MYSEEMVRDYTKFNKEYFCNLITALDWNLFDYQPDPVTQWDFVLNNVQRMLSVVSI